MVFLAKRSEPLLCLAAGGPTHRCLSFRVFVLRLAARLRRPSFLPSCLVSASHRGSWGCPAMLGGAQARAAAGLPLSAVLSREAQGPRTAYPHPSAFASGCLLGSPLPPSPLLTHFGGRGSEASDEALWCPLLPARGGVALSPGCAGLRSA